MFDVVRVLVLRVRFPLSIYKPPSFCVPQELDPPKQGDPEFPELIFKVPFWALRVVLS